MRRSYEWSPSLIGWVASDSPMHRVLVADSGAGAHENSDGTYPVPRTYPRCPPSSYPTFARSCAT
jgi:hypothetical protein